jgi:hypothetical protein
MKIWHYTKLFTLMSFLIFIVKNLHIEKYMRIKCGLGRKWAIKQISNIVLMHIMKVYKGVKV